jgi:hypothetical protein
MTCRRAFRPDADDSIARQAVEPARAIGAHDPGVEPPTIGHALERSRLACGEAEGRLRQGDSQREGAARDPLTIDAMACVDQLGRLGDLVRILPHWQEPVSGSFIGISYFHRNRDRDR